jgi:hypothetical protein
MGRANVTGFAKDVAAFAAVRRWNGRQADIPLVVVSARC